MPIRALDAASSPLLEKIPEVCDRYNLLAAEVLKIQSEDPGFYGRKDFQQVVEDALEVQDLLERSHYEVGFIGLFQVSKSTTFNRILRAPEQDRPAMEGQQGEATTASVTRVRPIPLDAPENLMTLRYLTRKGFETKREKLVKKLAENDYGLEINSDAPEDQLRQSLPALITEADRRRMFDVRQNLEYLLRTLEANVSLGGQLLLDGDKGREVNRPYAQRRLYINHPGDASIPLLRDIVLHYRTNIIPKEVEVIDMPGLGAGLDVDTVLTGELMERLNGVLLFCDVSKDLGGKLIGEVVSKLNQQFPDGLRGRVWVVFTRCDGLSQAHFSDGERNIFMGISGLLQRIGLSPDHACFVCNFWDGKSPDKFAEFLSDRAGTTDLPSKFPSYPELIKAFCELGRNGGIDRLRELITDTLGEEVRRETQREMGKKLDALADKIRTARELREQEKRFDPQRRKQLRDVLDKIKQLQAHVEGRRDLVRDDDLLIDYFRAPTLKLGNDLKASFDELYPDQPWLRAEPLHRIADEFAGQSWQLDEKLHHLLNSEVLPEVYQGIGREFAGLPAVPLSSCPQGVGPKWQEWALADRRDRGWRDRARVPTFQDKKLFVPPKVQPLHGLNGQTYRELMLEKILVASHQTGHAVRMRIRERLLVLEENFREALKVQMELERDGRSAESP